MKPGPPPAASAGKTAWICGGLLAAAVGLVFFQVTTFGFLFWDDPYSVSENAHLRQPWSGDLLAWMFSLEPARFIPTVWINRKLTHDLFGLAPWAFHLWPLVWHLANALLLLLLMERAWRRLDLGHAALRWRAATVAAALWALHPLRVEPVAWVTALGYTQATCFVLLSLVFYLRATGSPPGRGRRAAWGLTYLWATLAACTYPVVLTWVIVVPALDLRVTRCFPAKFWRAGDRAVLRYWVARIGLLLPSLLVVLYTVVGRIYEPGYFSAVPTLGDYSPLDRIVNAAHNVVYFVLASIYPLGMTPARYPLLASPTFTAPFIGAALLLLAWVGFALWQVRRRPGLLGFTLVFLVVGLPVYGLVEAPTGIPPDRHSYLATTLLFAAAGTLACAGWPALPGRARAAATGLCALLLAAHAGRSFAQLGIWENNETLFDTLEETPAVQAEEVYLWQVWFQRANQLYSSGQWARAVAYYDRLLGKTTSEAQITFLRANALWNLQRREEAIAGWERAAALGVEEAARVLEQVSPSPE